MSISIRLGTGHGLAAIFVLFASMPLFGDSHHTGLATRIMIMAVAATGLDVIVGLGGMISFGHAAFFGLGGYLVALAAAQYGVQDALVIWPSAAGLTMLMAVFFGWIALRTRGVAFIMITLAMAQMVFFIFSSVPALGGSDGLGMIGRNPIFGLKLDGHIAFHYTVLIVLILTTGVTQFLAATPFGLAVAGIRQNEARMRALGFDPRPYQLACFAYGGMLAGLAGAMATNLDLFVSPQNLHWMTSGTLLVIIILGGLRSPLGPILGASALLVLEEALANLTEHWMIFLGPLLICLVLLGGGGIANFLRRGRHGA